MDTIKKRLFVIVVILLCVCLPSCKKDDNPETKEEAGIIYREYDYSKINMKIRKAKVVDGYFDVLELIETNEKDPWEGYQYWKFKIKKQGKARILWSYYEFDFWISCWIEEITINEDLSYSSKEILLKLPKNSKEVGAGLKDDIYDDFEFEIYEP